MDIHLGQVAQYAWFGFLGLPSMKTVLSLKDQRKWLPLHQHHGISRSHEFPSILRRASFR